MNTKKILVLALLLAGCGALYFLSEQRAALKARKAEVSLTENFTASRAAQITIRAPGKEPVVLKMQAGGAWAVTSGKKSYEADNATIAALLQQIGGMRSATLVSKNPKNFDAFEVTDAKAVEVRVDDSEGKTAAHMLIGKNGPDIFSTYVRAKNAQSVYLVPGFLRNSADRELKDWRDKKIFKLRAGEITSLTITGDKNLQLRKVNPGAWQALCDSRVYAIPASTADAVAGSFAQLSAADFSDNATIAAKLERPLRTVAARKASGAIFELKIGGDKNGFQQFAKSGPEQVFIVEKSQLDSISPSCEDMKKASGAADNGTL